MYLTYRIMVVENIFLGFMLETQGIFVGELHLKKNVLETLQSLPVKIRTSVSRRFPCPKNCHEWIFQRHCSSGNRGTKI